MEIKCILLPTDTLQAVCCFLRLPAKRGYYLAGFSPPPKSPPPPSPPRIAFRRTTQLWPLKKKIGDVVSKGNKFLRREISTVLSDYRAESQSYIPVGQYCRKHRRVSSLFPIQGLPSFWGGGLLQNRCLFDSPIPHDLEQSVHSPQGPHWPSTTEKNLAMI